MMTRHLRLLIVLCTVMVVAFSKHIHPSNLMDKIMAKDLADETITIPTDIDGIPIEEIIHIKPSRFVPVNNVLFFQRYPLCAEGFKRDLLGVCREVWD